MGLNREQRMAAQVEEVVIEANLGHVEQLLPDFGNLLFQIVGWGYVNRLGSTAPGLVRATPCDQSFCWASAGSWPLAR